MPLRQRCINFLKRGAESLAPLSFIVFICAAASTSLAGEWIEGRVTHVRDVDTIEVNNLPIRLNGVDGPEMNERGGRTAKTWMTKLVLRKPLRCWLNGDKTYDRWVGTCYINGDADIGALAISAGHARDCPRYSGGKYAQFETKASRRLPRHGYCK